jgi:hypothetical protein
VVRGIGTIGALLGGWADWVGVTRLIGALRRVNVAGHRTENLRCSGRPTVDQSPSVGVVGAWTPSGSPELSDDSGALCSLPWQPVGVCLDDGLNRPQTGDCDRGDGIGVCRDRWYCT